MNQSVAQATYGRLQKVGGSLRNYATRGRNLIGYRKTPTERLQGMRVGFLKERRFAEATHVAFELLQRAIADAGDSPTPRQHIKVLTIVSWLVRDAARGRALPTGRAMVAGLFDGISPLPQQVDKFIEGSATLNGATLKEMSGLTAAEWKHLVGEVKRVTLLTTTPAADLVRVPETGPLDLDVAARLARLIDTDETPETSPLPIYDRADAGVRLTHVSVSGFRGSPGTVSLDLTKGGKPTSVLLWGDNGVGKSTLVDGIEFALQSRVDRSSDFTSSLRPKVRNLASPEGRAGVALSDGTQVERSLVVNESGRDVSSEVSVRPGFRIAPVVIRRSDILRFLDTDALSRGTIFFDYFPDADGGIGVRPDEELKMLDEERTVLLVVRADLAKQLSEHYPEEHRDLSDRAQLDAFVGGLIRDLKPRQDEDAIDLLPADVARLIHELRTTQVRLQKLKKAIESGVQRNNPVAYRKQLSRVRPALQSVGKELTDSFKTITRAEHVEQLDVLIAKSGPVSLDVVVRFDNGTWALPQQAFSEGYKDLVALLFFLVVTKKASELGQAKFLVLDDALQSVDASVRVGVMDFVLEEFKDWQLVITGHDRGWLAQLRALFNRKGRPFVERTISRWSFDDGIEVGGPVRLRVDTVRAGLEQHDERMTAAATGILLEEVCQELSWRLGASVSRRQGDRYTLGDLWPGVAKALRKAGLERRVDSVNQRLEIRNLLGGHFNDFADSIAWSDIRLLAEDVLAIYEAVRCDLCDDWIAKLGNSLSCRCGAKGEGVTPDGVEAAPLHSGAIAANGTVAAVSSHRQTGRHSGSAAAENA